MFYNLLANVGVEEVIILQRMDQPLGDLSFYSAAFRYDVDYHVVECIHLSVIATHTQLTF